MLNWSRLTYHGASLQADRTVTTAIVAADIDKIVSWFILIELGHVKRYSNLAVLADRQLFLGAS